MKTEQKLDTKYLLAINLKQLMKKTSFNKITVRMLTDASGINRQTFYYHFKDMLDLLSWMFQEETLGLVSSFEIASWQDGLRVILHYVQDNAEVCLNALHSLGHKQLRTFFYEDFYRLYTQLFSTITQNLDVDNDFKDFMCNLLIYGSEGLVVNWLENGMKETPEQLSSWLSILLDGKLRLVFESYAEQKKNPERQSHKEIQL